MKCPTLVPGNMMTKIAWKIMMKITLMPGKRCLKMSLPRLYWDYVTNCQSRGTDSEEGLSETSTINKVISCIDEEFVMFLFKINLREQYSTSINDK